MEIDDGEKKEGNEASAPAECARRYPALYLDAYADHPKSLLRLTTRDRCDGVHSAYAYLKFGFQVSARAADTCGLVYCVDYHPC